VTRAFCLALLLAVVAQPLDAQQAQGSRVPRKWLMAGVGALAQRAAGPLRARLPLFTSALLVVLGVLTVAGKFHAPHVGGSAAHPTAAHEHR